MSLYRVFREGFNAANNSAFGGGRPEEVNHVGTYEAADEDAAVNAAIAAGVTRYNNQTMWAELDSDCTAREQAEAEKHEGQIRVDYWMGTTAMSEWCSTQSEIDDCLDSHSNSCPPEFYDAEGDEIDYEGAVYIVGGRLDEEDEDEEED